MDSYVSISYILNSFFYYWMQLWGYNFSILVMYDVKHDVATYESKINWISIFANHKGATHMLNALVLIFDGVHFF